MTTGEVTSSLVSISWLRPHAVRLVWLPGSGTGRVDRAQSSRASEEELAQPVWLGVYVRSAVNIISYCVCSITTRSSLLLGNYTFSHFLLSAQ